MLCKILTINNRVTRCCELFTLSAFKESGLCACQASTSKKTMWTKCRELVSGTKTILKVPIL